LAEFRFTLPPLPEQRRIADILSSVDEAIQATQAVIEQTRKVRLLLLTTLFHRGQWDEGKALPNGWKPTLLDEVAKRGSGHTPSKSHPEYWNGGVKWVSLQDTKRLDDVFISETTAEISELGIANSSAVLHPAGTVVISRDATVGRSAILASPMAVSQHFIAWTCSPRLNNAFLYYWLQHMKPIFERIGAGSTIKTIGLTFFKSLSIPLPPLEVQESLGTRMMEVDQAIRANRAELDRLIVLKASLMSDLLTGRRRVLTDLAMAAE
jgi:type I restriction enzyme, S subunit